MAMGERYGAPATQIIRLMKAWQYPLRNVEPQDKMLVLTDDAMDPMIWASAMAVINEHGADPTLVMIPRREYHEQDVGAMARAAAIEADCILLLTTRMTVGNFQHSGKNPLPGNARAWLMEEMTAEVMLDGAGRATKDQCLECQDIQRRIGEIYDKGKMLRVTSKFGTNFLCDISDMPYSNAERWGKPEEPFLRNPTTGKLGGGTWPHGEIHIEAKPNTGNGPVVWDTTAAFPQGVWKGTIQLNVKDGTVVSVEGGAEADQLRHYIDTYGDENAWRIGGEIAIGTNKLAMPNLGLMRSEKKRLGAMHFGIGQGADRGLVNSTFRTEGVIDRPTVVVDDNIVVVEDGKIMV